MKSSPNIQGSTSCEATRNGCNKMCVFLKVTGSSNFPWISIFPPDALTKFAMSMGKAFTSFSDSVLNNEVEIKLAADPVSTKACVSLFLMVIWILRSCGRALGVLQYSFSNFGCSTSTLWRDGLFFRRCSRGLCCGLWRPRGMPLVSSFDSCLVERFILGFYCDLGWRCDCGCGVNS